MATDSPVRGRGRTRGLRTLVTLLAAAAVVLTAQADLALAGLGARIVKSQTVASGRWSAVFAGSLPTTSSTSGAQTVSLDTDSYWWISNNGTVALNGQFTVVITVTTTGAATAELQDCGGGAVMQTNNWDETTGLCNGTVTVVAYSGIPANYVVPAYYPVSAAIRFRLHVTTPDPGATATLSVTVTK